MGAAVVVAAAVMVRWLLQCNVMGYLIGYTVFIIHHRLPKCMFVVMYEKIATIHKWDIRVRCRWACPGLYGDVYVREARA